MPGDRVAAALPAGVHAGPRGLTLGDVEPAVPALALRLDQATADTDDRAARDAGEHGGRSNIRPRPGSGIPATVEQIDPKSPRTSVFSHSPAHRGRTGVGTVLGVGSHRTVTDSPWSGGLVAGTPSRIVRLVSSGTRPQRKGGMTSTAVAATLTLTLAGALTACGSGGGKNSARSGYAEVCADRTHNVRVDDFRCLGRTDPTLSWYYVPHSCGQTLTPARGTALVAGQGSFDHPRKGKVERGGFGSCPSKSSS